ncbi:hypothetical protein [Neobacillus sp. YIM B06451]|uniref:hypothetical protein n=1 Tax=Neobacillus sp. YIM B06451 TaxID=3070994 RepID=UPI00292F1BC3|nr:hypothetical protein [Neobacillus sp. YIM B06451]
MNFIVNVVFLFVSLVNYYWLSLAVGFLYVHITTDVLGMLLLVGLIIGPILSIGLSILTFIKLCEMPKRGRLALIGVHTILLIFALIFILF